MSAETTATKAVVSGVVALAAVASAVLALGVLHGTPEKVALGIIALAAVVGQPAAVYKATNKTLAVPAEDDPEIPDDGHADDVEIEDDDLHGVPVTDAAPAAVAGRPLPGHGRA